MNGENGIDERRALLVAGFRGYVLDMVALAERSEEFRRLLLREQVPELDLGLSQENICAEFPGAKLARAAKAAARYAYKRFVRKPQMTEALKPFEKELNAELHAQDYVDACAAVPRAVLEEDTRRDIDALWEKPYWERHYGRLAIERCVRRYGLELGDAYGEKLCRLDDERRGEDVGLPVVPAEGDEALVQKLLVDFTDEAMARRFLAAVRGMEDRDITSLANHYCEMGAIREGAKKNHLWKTLHDAGLYRAGEANWSAMVDFRKGRS